MHDDMEYALQYCNCVQGNCEYVHKETNLDKASDVVDVSKNSKIDTAARPSTAHSTSVEAERVGVNTAHNKGEEQQRTSHRTGSQHLTLVMMVCLVWTAVGAKERVIECECSTAECVSGGTHTCITTSQCYYQLLPSQHGHPPVTRGCLSPGWSLLCENQVPSVSVNTSWPYLHCCHTHLCNTATPHLPYHTTTTTTTTTATTRSNERDEGGGSLERLGVSSVEELRRRYGGGDSEGGEGVGVAGLHLTTLHLAAIAATVVFMVVVTTAGLCVVARYRTQYTATRTTPRPTALHVIKNHTLDPLLAV